MDYSQPALIFHVGPSTFELACPETVDVGPSCFTRYERHFIWGYSDGIAVLFVLFLNPSDYVTISHAKCVRDSRGSCKKRPWNVLERMNEDVVYNTPCHVENDLIQSAILLDSGLPPHAKAAY